MALRFVAPRLAAEKTVRGLEARLGARLPTPFRDLLTSVSNGGAVEPVAMQSDLRVGVVAVLGAERGNGLDIELRRAQLGRDRLPHGLIPIMDAEGGNVVCLSIRSDDFGTVWFWDHERELDGDASSLIAAGFDEFVKDLAPLDLTDSLSGIEEAWIDPAFIAQIDDDEETDEETD